MAKRMQTKTWHKVSAPRPWRAKIGEELIGTYLNTETRVGQFGEYKVHFVKVNNSRIFYVSGTVLNDLFAMIQPNMKVKIVFTGTKKAEKDSSKAYKCYELFTEEAIELRVADVG